uniref:Uncharacterized protein n=1 Tax=Esox lucius TaxID=8010 RepID=A0AAY5KXQ3_ESOLU
MVTGQADRYSDRQVHRQTGQGVKVDADTSVHAAVPYRANRQMDRQTAIQSAKREREWEQQGGRGGEIKGEGIRGMRQGGEGRQDERIKTRLREQRRKIMRRCRGHEEKSRRNECWEESEACWEESEACWEESEACWEESEACWEESEACWEESEACWEESEACWEESEACWEESEACWEESDVKTKPVFVRIKGKRKGGG